MNNDELKKAVERFDRRYDTFIREGLRSDEAYDLASAMYDRDRDPMDDRRVCFECKHLAVKYCTAIKDRFGRPSVQLRFILQRCDHFELKGKK